MPFLQTYIHLTMYYVYARIKIKEVSLSKIIHAHSFELRPTMRNRDFSKTIIINRRDHCRILLKTIFLMERTSFFIKELAFLLPFFSALICCISLS